MYHVNVGIIILNLSKLVEIIYDLAHKDTYFTNSVFFLSFILKSQS